jgi:hypothetical protein
VGGWVELVESIPPLGEVAVCPGRTEGGMTLDPLASYHVSYVRLLPWKRPKLTLIALLVAVWVVGLVGIWSTKIPPLNREGEAPRWLGDSRDGEWAESI